MPNRWFWRYLLVPLSLDPRWLPWHHPYSVLPLRAKIGSVPSPAGFLNCYKSWIVGSVLGPCPSVIWYLLVTVTPPLCCLPPWFDAGRSPPRLASLTVTRVGLPVLCSVLVRLSFDTCWLPLHHRCALCSMLAGPIPDWLPWLLQELDGW